MKTAYIVNPDTSKEFCGEHFLLRAIYLAIFEKAENIIIDDSFSPIPENVKQNIFASINCRKCSINLLISSISRKEQHILSHRFSAPAFRPPKWQFIMVDSNGGKNTSKELQLRLPEIPNLTDFHIHTALAYCNENMNIESVLAIAKMSGICHVNFSEHSGQLYVEPDNYWNNRCDWKYRQSSGNGFINRSGEYRKLLGAGRKFGVFSHGFELDVDYDGSVMLAESEISIADVRLGAVHFLSQMECADTAMREFMFRSESLMKYGVHILAHPFRVFTKYNLSIPEDLFEPLAKMLKQYKVAVEVNFHTNEPELEFFAICVKKGVKIALGSDSHNLYEVGFLQPHLEFLRQLDVYRNINDILLSYEQLKLLSGK